MGFNYFRLPELKTNFNMNDFINQLKFDSQGLICAIVQDEQSGRVLMQAWMNREAVEKTVETKLAHYYSRSRQKQWLKGEQSGHFQKVKEIRLDCDGDSLLLKVEQVNNIACHTGRESCFYRILENNAWNVIDPVIKNSAEIYK